ILQRLAIAVFVLALPLAGQAAADPYIDALQSMMADLRPQSRQDAQTIKSAYGPMAKRSTFLNRGDMEAALDTDELALMPEHTGPLNIALRLNGRHPIAEKDLAYQASYLGARPAALGLLYEIAARVTSGPIEVTSLVRHLEYQRALGATNGNARTAVPTHAMGMAFDIALVNTPLATVYEIRDVLREMRRAGLLYFIGETQQLVFHVVPRPAWLGYFEAVHMARLHAPVPPLDTVPVIAALMQREIPPPPVVALSWWQRMLLA
ncbi:MAG TPA: DUF5715 family protein, partial [Vicinamibacterales bacterium]|nr:DUF5715 family protein [Vicinamibacterales bacterium]